MQGQANVEVAALLGFCVWLRNVAQPETTVLVHCRGGCAISLMTNLLVTRGVLHHGDTAVLINNIPCLLFDLLERTHDAQCRLGQKKLTNTSVL